MKAYKATITFEHWFHNETQTEERVFILEDDESLLEAMQMAYRGWADILEHSTEEIQATISKQYIVNRAKDMIRFD